MTTTATMPINKPPYVSKTNIELHPLKFDIEKKTALSTSKLKKNRTITSVYTPINKKISPDTKSTSIAQIKTDYQKNPRGLFHNKYNLRICSRLKKMPRIPTLSGQSLCLRLLKERHMDPSRVRRRVTHCKPSSFCCASVYSLHFFFFLRLSPRVVQGIRGVQGLKRAGASQPE